MSIADWSIRNPVPTIIVFIVSTGLGLFGFAGLPVTEMPVVDVPVVTVRAQLPGASSSQVETEVTRKIEASLSSVERIQHVSSVVAQGSSRSVIQFELEADLKTATSQVSRALASIRAELPAQMAAPTVEPVTQSGLLLAYAVSSSTRDAVDLSWLADDVLVHRLASVRGVARVVRVGGGTREIDVSLDPAKLAALRVAVADVAVALPSLLGQASAGGIVTGQVDQTIRVSGGVRGIDQVRGLTMMLPGGRRVRLGEVATVADGNGDDAEIALVDGRPVLLLQVYGGGGTDAIQVAAAVRSAMARSNEQFPDLHVTEVSDETKQIAAAYDHSLRTLCEGMVLAAIVVGIFLRNWRATIIGVITIPLSILPAFAVMRGWNFTLNTVTFLALSLVVGVLVDDAIVEVENVIRHIEGGKDPVRAAREAVAEIALAVIATSLSLVAVFLPTAFIGGVVGRFFVQFGWTASVAVLASLVTARLLTPMLAARMLRSPRPGDAVHHGGAKWLPIYRTMLRYCLSRPVLVSAFAAVILLGSFFLLTLLPKSFLPPQPQNDVSITVRSPPGAGIKVTTDLAELARQSAAGLDDVVSSYTVIGGVPDAGGNAQSDAQQAVVTFNLKPVSERALTQAQLQRRLRERLDAIPGARFSMDDTASGRPYSLILSADDPSLLDAASARIMADLRSLPGIGYVRSSAAVQRPEIIINPDAAKAAYFGVANSDIARSVRLATSGEFYSNLARLDVSGRQVPVRVRLNERARDNAAHIGELLIAGSRGYVRLSTIATISLGVEPQSIRRDDGRRSVRIDTEVTGLSMGDVAEQVDDLPSVAHLPGGVVRTVTGDADWLDQLFDNFFKVMIAGIFCVCAILVLLFRSFWLPLIILIALPLSVGGALGALLLLGYTLSLPALIGILMLMGLAAKNSILLVERAVTLSHANLAPLGETILDACLQRARPVVMTTVAMIAGMVPLAFGGGTSEFGPSMAVALIGGLLTSTSMSLLFIPVALHVFGSIKGRLDAQ